MESKQQELRQDELIESACVMDWCSPPGLLNLKVGRYVVEFPKSACLQLEWQQWTQGCLVKLLSRPCNNK